jgi:hypothetical protein
MHRYEKQNAYSPHLNRKKSPPQSSHHHSNEKLTTTTPNLRIRAEPSPHPSENNNFRRKNRNPTRSEPTTQICNNNNLQSRRGSSAIDGGERRSETADLDYGG